MTVVVGPNNSGKSMMLRELREFIGRGEQATAEQHQIIECVTPAMPASGDVRTKFMSAIEKDLAPIRRGLGEASRTLGASDEGGLAATIAGLSALTKLGQAKHLSDAGKLNLTRFDELDLESALKDITLHPKGFVKRLVDLGHMLLVLVEEHQEVIERIAELESESRAEAIIEELVEEEIIRMDGYACELDPYTILLDGRTRIGLVDPQKTHSLFQEPQNFMMRLRSNRPVLERLRALTFEAFGYHLSISLADMRKARFMLSDRPPENYEYETTSEALEYFRRAKPIEAFSDGLRSYVGLQANLLSDDYRIILIDEPEAFLHPPLARRLGQTLTKLASERGASIFAATHSPDFLMGCIDAQKPINVIRLGYRNEIPTARALAPADLKKMMTEPLLRSTGVLGALFHQSAVVCEGDSDSAFYQEIAERIRNEEGDATLIPATRNIPAIRDCVFMNAHGKASIPKLMGALRKMGIPAAAVVDLDVLKGHGVASELLKMAGVAESQSSVIGSHAANIMKDFEAVAKAELEKNRQPASDGEVKKRMREMLSKTGVESLDSPRRRSLEGFLATMAHQGIFIPPRGELESWLPRLGKGIAKQGWLAAIFDRMGVPDDPERYVRPGPDDVWAFMRDVGAWLDRCSDDPSQLGWLGEEDENGDGDENGDEDENGTRRAGEYENDVQGVTGRFSNRQS